MLNRASLRTKRSICCLMLLAWVFAVLSGTVNACVVDGHEGPGVVHLLQAQGEHQHSSADHDHDHGGGHAGCSKFCKDESVTVTKYKSLDTITLAPVLVNSNATLPVCAAERLSAQRCAARPPAHGPPLVIRFLRLTL